MTLARQDNGITLLSNYTRHQNNSNYSINYLDLNNPGRIRLETFIRKVFRKYYNADIDHFYPNLLAIDADNSLISENDFIPEQSLKAVAGVRCADDEPLFSEYYLADNLEMELEHLYGENCRNISRQAIVEVGNLAPANVGQMRWLIASITGFLYSAGFQYIVFTAVPGVYNAFKRMNVPLQFITEAKQDFLPEEIKHKWGPEYYQLKPMVMSGDIKQGYDIMKKNIYNSNQQLIPLFEKACQLGRQSRLCRTQLNGNVA